MRIREGLGAVSAIGAGINGTLENMSAALAAVADMGAPLLGASTSSFRITLLMEEATLRESVRRLHRALITEGEPTRSPAD